MIRQLHAEQPDYLFARLAVARFHLDEGRLAEAEEFLRPVQTRTRFHTSEISAYSIAQIDLLLAKKNPEAARMWLNTWKKLDPDHRGIQVYEKRLKLNPPGLLGLARRKLYGYRGDLAESSVEGG